ncbi:SCO3933 family regulatory protein [Streptomyces sp. NBC_00467]|uniref:SCO3933 family regulatory protein n=1 Tax=Streptomyces sp. NBC_00467 TaxID=2975752 RepID=UPI002E19E096
MRVIPVDMTGVTVMVAQPPQQKMKDKQNGVIAVDTETKKPLMAVDVLFVGNGNAEVVTVTVIEDDISGDLVTGTPVALTGLMARPWENEFNGQKRHGISFRAAAVTSLAG